MFEVVAEGVQTIGGQNDRGIGTDDRTIVRGIERHKLFDRHVGQARGGLDVDGFSGVNAGEIGAVGDLRQAQFGHQDRIAKNVLQRLQFGYVVPGFIRHVQAAVVGRHVAFGVLVDRPFDRTFAPVVGGQGKVPVTVHVVNALQIIECCVGRCNDIPAVITPPVLGQVETFAGGRDELPQAGRICPRIGHRVERAFNHWQQCQFGRHAARLDLLDNVVKIGAAALRHAAQGIRSIHVPLLVIEHQIIVQITHPETVADAVPDVVRGGGEIDAADRVDRSPQFLGGQRVASAVHGCRRGIRRK